MQWKHLNISIYHLAMKIIGQQSAHHSTQPVAESGLRWGSQGAQFLVMALCLGLVGPKVLFGTYFHMQKVEKWAQGGHEGHGSLDLLLTASLNMVNISSLESEYGNIWRTMWTRPGCINWLIYLQFLLFICTRRQIDNNGPIIPFDLPDESVDDPAPIWTLFSHTEIYFMAIGLLIPTGLWLFCCYLFWYWPAILVHWPFQFGSSWHTIVDDDVEEAPIYRSNGMVGCQPVIWPHKNHDLPMKWEPTWTESQQKQQAP